MSGALGAAERPLLLPCHNGTFDTSGVATGGPPGDAGQNLPLYPLRVEQGMLFIEVPVDRLVATDRPAAVRPV